MKKSNEITAIPELLELLALKGCIVSIDAMGCQHAIASKIVDKKADYILALKGNQGLIHQDVSDFFHQARLTNFKNILHDFYEEYDAGHGRIESRWCWVINPTEQSGCFSKLNKWRNLQRIVMVQTKRELKDNTTEDTRFYISSSKENAKFFLEAVRKHWQVENALHWTLDVTF